MVKYLVLVMALLFSSFTYAKNCDVWEYASLLYTTTSNGLEPKNEKFNLFVMWFSPDGITTWQDNKLQTGFTNKTLKEYFQINSKDYLAVLNSLGNQGWESYGYDVHRRTDYEENQSWQFKRCKA